MRATLKTPVLGGGCGRFARKTFVVLAWGFWAISGLLSAQETGAASNFVAQAEAAHRAAQAVRATNANDLKTLIDVARTAFDYADLAGNDTLRESIALAGIASAREAVAQNPSSAGGNYYLALTLGQLARTKMLGALKILTEMEQSLKRVIMLDPKFDHAGGHRTIGILYLEAPGWPTSIGNRNKARFHLSEALALAPEFPDNHLSMMEALAKWHEWKPLRERMAAYEAGLPAAKAKFTGADWDYEWFDWNRRFKSIQTKARSHE